MDKNYDHNTNEEKINSLWEKEEAFTAVVDDNKPPFSIIMPPPNANDPLHVGHAMFVAVEDILIRFHRMKGDATLWLPGTDHAGIETQFVFEKKLAKEGKSRFNFDRETLFKMIWDYVQTNSNIAVDQMKRLGASADWGKFKFTLDSGVVKLVNDTFLKLYNDGLVYRGERLVNYCPKCGTGYSELEVEHETRTSSMVYMKYGPFTIATVRPETKFRDTALAVNPNDERYKKFIGQTVEVVGLLGPTKMIIVPDPEVDPEFGTGIMKVTPAHDAHDFELGRKFDLPVNPLIGLDGRMNFEWFLEQENTDPKYRARAERYHKQKAGEVRKLMIDDLREDGLLVKIDDAYSHRASVCYRCKTVLEPVPLPQFFIKTRPLADAALKALDNDETKILGVGREKILRHWLTNVRDWNISRQIVWGIRIPAWYNAAGHETRIVVSFIDPHNTQHRGTIDQLVRNGFTIRDIKKGLQQVIVPVSGEKENNVPFVIQTEEPQSDGVWIQETDTFDTWFSSGQWPVVTLMSEGKDVFDYFYPTTVMETGYDILPIWVMRMMLLCIYTTGKSPFETVYLHGLVRDETGRKMSKSIGNVINPIVMVSKYGADALRMALVMSSTPGQDKNVGESSIRGMRNFSNKIWNATRFVLSMEANEADHSVDFEAKLNNCVLEVTTLLNETKIGLAAETIYNVFWHWYCDEVIESAKSGQIGKSQIEKGLMTLLKLLHPFVPYVTEAVWSFLDAKDSPILATTTWPKGETQ